MLHRDAMIPPEYKSRAAQPCLIPPFANRGYVEYVRGSALDQLSRFREFEIMTSVESPSFKLEKEALYLVCYQIL